MKTIILTTETLLQRFLSRLWLVIVMTVIAGIFTASCSSTREGPPADQAPRPEFRAVVVQPDFSDAIGKEWYLVEIQTPSGPAKFSRAVLEAHGMGDCYTLRFDQERLAGKGAPNRYTAPYQLGKDAAISIQAIAGTLMTSLSEPPGLGEQEYYNYLERVSRWNLEEDTLNLYTRNTSDELMILVYQLRRE